MILNLGAFACALFSKKTRVDPRFPAGLPFPVPEILEFEAFRAILENTFQ